MATLLKRTFGSILPSIAYFCYFNDQHQHQHHHHKSSNINKLQYNMPRGRPLSLQVRFHDPLNDFVFDLSRYIYIFIFCMSTIHHGHAYIWLLFLPLFLSTYIYIYAYKKNYKQWLNGYKAIFFHVYDVVNYFKLIICSGVLITYHIQSLLVMLISSLNQF